MHDKFNLARMGHFVLVIPKRQVYILKIVHRGSESFQLTPQLSDGALQILLRQGLAKRAPEEYAILKRCREEASDDEEREIDRQKKELNNRLNLNAAHLRIALQHVIVDSVCSWFG
jgi:hypothetical protein